MAQKISDKNTSVRWNLTPLFDGDNDPRIEEQKKLIHKKSYAFIDKWKNRSDYLNDPDILADALREYESLMRRYGTDGNPGYYFWLRSQSDRNNTDIKAKLNKVEEFSRKIQNDIQFFHLRIAKIPKSLQRKFLNHGSLQRYRHYLERIFAESSYLLSEAEEKIMNLKASTSYRNWVRMTSDFLSRQERKVLLEDGRYAFKTMPEIMSLLKSRNRKVRDSSARALNEILANHSDIAEVEINSILANKKVDDELRNVSRPDLLRHISDDMDSCTVDALLDAVEKRYDISCRFYELKAKLLGMKKLRYHDRIVEYGNIPAKYSFSRSVELIRNVFGRLDKEFLLIFNDFLKNGQFDVYPRKGKGSGAFCVHHLISQPTYIFLNHTDKLSDVLTLAHELGHGINNELIRKKQHALNFGTPTSTAEVASTFMEDFVLREIMAQADDELKLSIMMMKLNDDVSTIFRQVACYRFEQELHSAFRQKGYLSKSEIGSIFQKHMSAYMGRAVEQSKGSENWWVYWSHIRQFFYVYSYAGGLLISKSLQNSVHKDPVFIFKVKDFLSAGLSDSPFNIFMRLGIDISDREFWNKGLDEVDSLLNETGELSRKLKKSKANRKT